LPGCAAIGSWRLHNLFPLILHSHLRRRLPRRLSPGDAAGSC
jgi:hypothetical protein